MPAIEAEFVQNGLQDVHTEYSLVGREVNHISNFVQCVWFQYYDDIVD